MSTVAGLGLVLEGSGILILVEVAGEEVYTPWSALVTGEVAGMSWPVHAGGSPGG